MIIYRPAHLQLEHCSWLSLIFTFVAFVGLLWSITLLKPLRPFHVDVNTLVSLYIIILQKKEWYSLQTPTTYISNITGCIVYTTEQLHIYNYTYNAESSCSSLLVRSLVLFIWSSPRSWFCSSEWVYIELHLQLRVLLEDIHVLLGGGGVN